MSTTIDERVVSMQFDNKLFEKNVSTTMSTLDKLKEKLHLSGATRGLEEVSNASKRVDMTTLGNGVESVRLKFSALQVFATTALTRISNSAINAGKKLISSLTIDPIKTGLSEYETQLNSVQTILSNTKSKGSTLEDVNAALDELNTYADKTIYNFTEMTKNIGTFTAAGVDLDTSVSAIKGIANLAAVSGSTSQQASTAMYQLSQALSSGTVRLMDWNSVVNAGMGGEVFQNALKDTAKVHGIAIDDIIEKNGSFRESLKEEWLSAEILTETLAKFTGDLTEAQLVSMGYTQKQAAEILELGKDANDAATKVKTFTQLLDTLKESAQSGWAQTWEIVIGDFEAARSMWTKVSDELGGIIGKSADARNALLSGTFESGWNQLLGEGIMDEAGYSNWIKKVAKGHGVAIDEMIKDTGSFEAALKQGLKSGDITSDMLSEALNGLTNDYSNLSEKQLENLGYTADQVETLKKLNETFQNGSNSMDEFANKIERMSGRELLMDSFKNIYIAIKNVINTIKDAWNDIFPAATMEEKTEKLYNIIDGFHDFTVWLAKTTENATALKTIFKGVFAVLDIVVTAIKAVVKAAVGLISNFGFVINIIVSLVSALSSLIIKFRDYIKESNVITTITGAIGTAIQKVISTIEKFGSAVKTKIETKGLENFLNALKKIWKGISNVFNKIKTGIGKFFSALGEVFSGFNLDTFLAIFNSGVFAGFLVIYNKLVNAFKKPSDKLSSIMDGFKGILDGAKGVLDGVRETLETYQQKLKAEVIKTIATSIAILAASILVLSFIDKERLNNALVAVTTLMIVLMSAMSVFNRISKDGLADAKNAISLTKLAGTLLILAFALKKFGELSWGEIARGLTAMTGCMVILMGSLTIMQLINKIQGKTNIIDTNKKLIAMASGLLILGIALKKMSGMSWEEIGRGLVGVTASMIVLLGALTIIQLINKIQGKGQIKLAKTLTVMVSALVSVATVLALMSNLSWEEIGRGLVGMTTSLVVLIGALTLLTLISKMQTGKVYGTILQIMTVTISLFAIVGILKLLGAMNWDEIWKGLTAMSLSLVALVGAIAILSLIKPSIGVVSQILALTVSLLVVAGVLKALGSMNWDEIWKGLTAMTLSLGVLVGALALLSLINSSSVVSVAALLLLTVAIAALIPSLIVLGNLDTGVIVKGILAIAAAIGVLGLAAYILTPVAPVMLMISASMLMLGEACIATGAGLILISVGLAALVAPLTAFIGVLQLSGMALLAFLETLAKKMIGLIPYLLTAIGEGIVAFCGVIAKGATAIGQAIVAVLLAVIDICVQVIPRLAEGLVIILLGVMEALAKFIPQLAEALFNLIIGVLGAFVNFIPKLIQVAVNLFVKVLEGFINALQSIDPNILVNGIKAVGFMTVLMIALAAVASLIPSAMLGVLGMGVVIAELALVLAAIGALARIPGLQEIIADGGNLLQAIGTAIGQFVGGIIGGIGKGITASLPAMASDLSNFMTNLRPFLDGLRSIDSSMVESGKSLASLILTITAANILERLTSWMTGGTSLTKFGAELAGFGKGIKQFATEVNGIDGETVKAAAEAGKNLGQMAKSIPTSGGLWDLLAGENDIEGFGNQLGAFGKGIKAFAEETDGVNSEGIKMAAEAGKTLAEMAKSLPTSGGLWDLIAGKNDMTSLSKQIKTYGGAISEFSAISASISLENVAVGTAAGKMLAQMVSSLPTSGGLWDSKNVNSFAKQLKKFGKALKDFVNDVADMGDVSTTIAQIKALSAALTSFSIRGLDGLTNSLKNGKTKIAKLVADMLQAGIDAVKNKIKSFESAGKTFMEKFILAIKSYKTKVKDSIVEVVGTSITSVKTQDNYNRFYDTGKYFVQGFASGIGKNTFLASAKAKAMAAAAARAAAKELDEHSPSKVGFQIGDYFGFAFVDAIDGWIGNAYGSASEMANAAKTGLTNVLSKIAYAIENGIDTQPTIAPVLDLSNIKAGASAINGMFGMTPSVGVLSRVNSISSTMNANQNGNNSDVVSAINDLKDTLNGVSGDTYNLNGVTIENGSDVQEAIETIIRALKIERRV